MHHQKCFFSRWRIWCGCALSFWGRNNQIRGVALPVFSEWHQQQERSQPASRSVGCRRAPHKSCTYTNSLSLLRFSGFSDQIWSLFSTSTRNNVGFIHCFSNNLFLFFVSFFVSFLITDNGVFLFLIYN